MFCLLSSLSIDIFLLDNSEVNFSPALAKLSLILKDPNKNCWRYTVFNSLEWSKNPGSNQDHHMGSVQDKLNSDVPSHESFHAELAVSVDRALKREPGPPVLILSFFAVCS